jgi:hypothetical protein
MALDRHTESEVKDASSAPGADAEPQTSPNRNVFHKRTATDSITITYSQ